MVGKGRFLQVSSISESCWLVQHPCSSSTMTYLELRGGEKQKLLHSKSRFYILKAKLCNEVFSLKNLNKPNRYRYIFKPLKQKLAYREADEPARTEPTSQSMRDRTTELLKKAFKPCILQTSMTIIDAFGKDETRRDQQVASNNFATFIAGSRDLFIDTICLVG